MGASATARRDGELHGGLARLIFPDTASFGWMKHSPFEVPMPPSDARRAIRRRYRWSPDGAMLPRPRGGRGAQKRDTPFSPSERTIKYCVLCSADPLKPQRWPPLCRTSRPPDPHRLLPAPVSVDEHHQAVFWEPLMATTSPDFLLAGVAESDTSGRTATLPGFLFYVRSSSRNGINGAMAQCSHCSHISRDGRRPSAEERGRE
jgi:hypothetical protein